MWLMSDDTTLGIDVGVANLIHEGKVIVNKALKSQASRRRPLSLLTTQSTKPMSLFTRASSMTICYHFHVPQSRIRL